MLHEKLRVTLGILVLFFLFIVLATADSFNYGELGKPPLVAATLDSQEDQIISDELDELLKEDTKRTILKPLDENEKGAYLLMRWSTRVDSITLYMRQIGGGAGDSYFEVWGQGDKKVASGKLTQNYQEYYFDLSETGMYYEDYALFNYGPSDIEVNYVLGHELPETKTNKLLDIFAEGFI